MPLTILDLYNSALHIVGERPLLTVDEDRPARYLLDEAYDDKAVAFCLELVRPKFALKVATLTTPSSSAAHALDNVYTLPADYISFHALYEDDELERKVTRYILEGRTLATDIPVSVVLRYVSSGYAITDWTPSFSKVVEAYLAKTIAPRLNPNKTSAAEALFRDLVEVSVAMEGVKEAEPLPHRATFALTDDWRHVYNDALAILGEDNLLHNDDDSLQRTILDDVVNSGALDYVLTLVRPRFALKVDQLTVSTPSPESGYDNVFALPADYVGLIAVYQDERLDEPVHRYFLEAGSLAAEVDTVFLRYISNTVATSSWTSEFKRTLAAYMAKTAAPRMLKGIPWDARASEFKRVSAEFEARAQLAVTLEGYKEPQHRARPQGSVLTAGWLNVYNTALQLLRLPPILSIEDDSERRSALDNAVNTGAVATVLTNMGWDFAYKTTKATYNPAYEVEWGYQYAFDIPDDFERVDQVSGDEYFRDPQPYYQEGTIIYADVQELYLRYVSSDYGTDPAAWPEYFKNVVAYELASRCGYLPEADLEHAHARGRKLTYRAYSIDVQRNPPQKISEGSWSRTRRPFNRYRGRP